MKTFFGRVLAVVIGIGLFFVVCFIILSIVTSVFSMDDSIAVQSGTVLQIKLDEPVIESNMEIETSIFTIGQDQKSTLLAYLNAIDKASEDDNIKGISIELDTTVPEEITQIELLREKLLRFKESGKFVYAYTNRIQQGDYYLASVADSIFHNPLGTIEIKGLSSEVMFFKNLGEKYGIEFEVIRHGDYKAAVEPFIREDLSDENKEQLTQVVTQIWDGMTTKIAKSRALSQASINMIADSLLAFDAQKALNYSLVDVLSQESDYHEFLKTETDVALDKKLKTITLSEYAKTIDNKFNSDKIAVLYASGMILPGDSFYGIQSETYKEAIQKIARNDKIKGVVLRVNSGGGDANTSEEILHELRKLSLDKPLVVSFGEVAASGGYYIGMSSEKIFSEPYTITGSIGVLGMVPNVKGLVNDLGITTDYVQTNANTIYYSPFQGLSPQGKQMLEASTENIYATFVNHVAENRNKSFDQIDALGGGRIYTGIEAKRLGLVDEIGTLEDAIAYVANAAELDAYQIKSYPQKANDLETLMKELNLSTEVKAQITQSMDIDLLKVYTKLDQLKKLNGVQVLLPYDMKIK